MRILTALFLFAAALPGVTPAFLGPGLGADIRAGVAALVIAVTNLDDAGPGSFRATCEAQERRIVVFRAGGLGDGIRLRDHQLVIDTHDVILRYLRSRPGDISGKEVAAISIAGSTHGRPVTSSEMSNGPRSSKNSADPRPLDARGCHNQLSNQFLDSTPGWRTARQPGSCRVII